MTVIKNFFVNKMNTDWNELEDGRVPIETPNWAQAPLMVPMISSSRGAAVVHSCQPGAPHRRPGRLLRLFIINKRYWALLCLTKPM